jgi:hypothetical protein
VSQPSQPERSTAVLVIAAPLHICDVPGLCDRLRVLLQGSDATVVACDVRALAPDAISLEALARLQLTARRLGARIRLQRASPDLERLLSFAGLAGVLACPVAALRVERERQPEQREHPRGVEERVERDDAIP